MDNIWMASALWIALALVASLISICVAMSVALTEIIVGAIAGNVFSGCRSRPGSIISPASARSC